MKYQSSNTKIIYDISFDKVMSICPECTPQRKKKNSKDLKFYKDTNSGYCHHCNTTFFEYSKFEKKDFIVPKWENKTKLSDKAVKYFNSRMIKQETLNEMGVYSDTEWMPQHKKDVECICFPYFDKDTVRNIKFRGANKAFKLYSGAELLFYNFDALKDAKEIIICEGEIDALSWCEVGKKNVISVPNGASVKTMEYLDSSIHLFDNIEKVYLSTDNDTVGIELRDEFIRRLGAEKCYTLSFKEQKDANAYLCKYGVDLLNVLEDAKPIPISGLVTVSSLRSDIMDLYENGETKGLEIAEPEIDKFVTWELGRLATITGRPGSGKSEFVDFIVSKLNLKYGWKAAYFTPENYPLKYHYRKLHTKYSGKQFDKKTDTTDFDTIYEHINDNYSYIMDEGDMSVNSVMKSAKMLVKQKGIKILVIDPYNKLEHDIKNGQSETQYVSKFLDTLVNFSRFNNVLIFLVAHPKKVSNADVISLYDIAGSANFYNKTDYGITVDRVRDPETGLMSKDVNVFWQKIKFRHLGEQGMSALTFNVDNGRYYKMATEFNNMSWLGVDMGNNVQRSIPEIDTSQLEDYFNNESREVWF